MIYGTIPLSPRVRRKQANLERILDAAMSLVIAEGFAALSIHRLAEILDYTPGALYRYFSSKDALISALAIMVIESFAEKVESEIDAAPKDAPLKGIIAGLMTYADMGTKEPHQFGLLSMLMAQPRMLVADPKDAAPAVQAVRGAFIPLCQAFESAKLAEEINDGDSQERALIAFSMVHGVLQMRKQESRDPGFFQMDSLLTSSLKALFLGWGASLERIELALSPIGAPVELHAVKGDKS